ncbi:MAG: ATP-binding protein [Silvibacterium sp.]
MSDLIERALKAKRESKHIEFKSCFDPTSDGDWCEVIKDIVAIANSGGGVIIFGLNSNGAPADYSVEEIGRVDPADISNKIAKYAGPVDIQLDVADLEKEEKLLLAFIIQQVSIPLVFLRPGTYNIVGGKQKTAFGQGTVYFRHGAKSEPGTTDDIRSVVERQLEQVRNSWIKGVRKVVEAPPGSQVVIQSARNRHNPIQANAVRVVNDPNAMQVALTRDPKIATGTFMHEEISQYIFDEINNVVDANMVLAKGQHRFFFGQSVYYRVYAERGHVNASPDQFELLFRSAVSDFYAPGFFWAIELDAALIAQIFSAHYLAPKTPQIYWLMRMAVLLGPNFCRWLTERWDAKWGHHSQPPSFYHTFKAMSASHKGLDLRLRAARSMPATRITVPNQTATTCAELLAEPEKAMNLLSSACMAIFEGDQTLRTTARTLDYLAYGAEIVRRASEIAPSVVAAIGNQQIEDYNESTSAE